MKHYFIDRYFEITASEKAYDVLAKKYGTSAATTYFYLRSRGVTALFALAQTRLQVEKLGINYPGGLACTPYRQSYYINQE